jgi:UDP-N-acetylmuramate dehydrogenase
MDMSDTGALLANLHGSLRQDEPMAKHVSWRAGGAAKVSYQPANVPDLCAFLRTRAANEPILFVGLGSNLLVRDGGFDGTVVFTHHALTGIRQEGGSQLRPTFHVGAGVPAPHLARHVAKNGGAGSEWMCGVPGTIGGALAMNAGCYGGETWNHVIAAETVDRNGNVRLRQPSEYDVGYRHVTLKESSEEWFISGVFVFERGEEAPAMRRMKKLLSQRVASQPLNQPNAGSVFRNPPGDFAARLIESCALKGVNIGGAQVSAKHANFIVNTGNATAGDIESLVDLVQTTVGLRTGVDLVREVRIVGKAKP